MRDGTEFTRVLGVRLDAQRDREDELTDRSREAGEESIEGLDTPGQQMKSKTRYLSFLTLLLSQKEVKSIWQKNGFLEGGGFPSCYW